VSCAPWVKGSILMAWADRVPLKAPFEEAWKKTSKSYGGNSSRI
jgi:hypothetical protein